MKYIFDFDNVLFHTTSGFKEHMYQVLDKLGITRKDVEDYYAKNPQNHFVLKTLLQAFSLDTLVYNKITCRNQEFANVELLDAIKGTGKENCFVVSFGDKEFQLEKLLSIGIEPYFQEIIIVPDSKKDEIERICDLYPNEDVYFIDDKAKHFEDLDTARYPKLHPILFTSTSQLRDDLPDLFQHK